ncbi:MAG: CBS domain-containing protein [Eubacterium sp.]|nr:CBS domain-containing protein [Eubacterium sp.]
MNISFFLLPKSEVVYVHNYDTVGEALRKLHENRYQTVPVVDQEGKYVGTISEGDFLWNLIVDYRSKTDRIKEARIAELKKKCFYYPVSIDADISELDRHIIDQNFVPVVDGRNVFIGIITRREIMKALLAKKKED